MYDMPDEIDVKADGALRIITLNRPDALNAVNDNLHVGLAKIWEALNEDTDARAAVITGAIALAYGAMGLAVIGLGFMGLGLFAPHVPHDAWHWVEHLFTSSAAHSDAAH